MASPEDQPLTVLSVAREALANYDATGLWSNLDFALRRVVMPLVRLVGTGLRLSFSAALPPSRRLPPTPSRSCPEPRPRSNRNSARTFHRLLNEGRLLTRQELLRVALDEIETCLDKP
jgi:hypothetical protein